MWLLYSYINNLKTKFTTRYLKGATEFAPSTRSRDHKYEIAVSIRIKGATLGTAPSSCWRDADSSAHQFAAIPSGISRRSEIIF
jgi:hypothetical protein